MLLTIAIPTYNRNDYLLRNLPRLLDQLDDRCTLLIVDNHSDVPVEDTLRSLLANYHNKSVRIVRHPTNVGGGQNLLRCVELCQTEWLWLIGDDDALTHDAASIVLRDISSNPDLVHLNYCSPHFSRPKSYITHGLNEYIERLDSFSNALFMSVGVYNRKAILSQIRYGYLYAYSWAPHFATMLVSLGDNGGCLFSAEKLIEEMSQVPVEERWSTISTLVGRMTLLDLPMSTISRRILAKKLSDKPALEYIAIVLAKTALRDGKSAESLYLYDHICYRMYYFDSGLLRRIRISLYRILVRFPSQGLPIVAFVFWALARTRLVRGNELGLALIGDRFARI